MGAFDAGDFAGSIKRLTSGRELWEDTSVGHEQRKIAGHKYLAFSYCVTERLRQCRQEFVRALEIDPQFMLAPSERGHPIWGPEYERARRQMAARAKPAPATKPAPR